MSRQDLTRRQAAVAVAAITLVAVALRLVRLGSDLWLDEIAPLVMYGGHSPLEIWTDMTRPNNHPLSTLLVNGMRALFGDREWAIRLPAALFGSATVPALYRLARLGTGRPAAVAAAGLLAVAPPHVLYSQSARGYSAQLFFFVVATALLLRGLARPRPRTGALYAVTMGAGFASHPLTGFAFAAHLVTATAHAVRGDARRRAPLRPWLAGALGGAALAAGLLYAPALEQLVAGVRSSYLVEPIGFAPLSADFARELARGLTGGSLALLAAAALLAVPLLGLGITGLERHRWELPVCLLGPPAATLVAIAAVGGTLYPRFLILGLPGALLLLAAGVFELGRRLALDRAEDPHRIKRRLLAVVLLVAAAAAAPRLAVHYDAPKQSYRAALDYLEGEIEKGATVVVADVAVAGFRYYAQRRGGAVPPRLVLARESEEIERALAAADPGSTLLVTTLTRHLADRSPLLAHRLEREWVEQRSFPASIGGGEIRIWHRREPEGRHAEDGGR